MTTGSNQERRRVKGNSTEKPDSAPAPDRGILRDERGQEQPRDKARAQQVNRPDQDDDPPGRKP